MDQTDEALCLEVVRTFVKSYPDMDMEDLMQEAYTAFLEGLKSHDLSDVESVSDFVRPMIEERLQAYCNEMGPLPMVPVAEEVSLFEQVNQKRVLADEFKRRSQEYLSIEEIDRLFYCRSMDPSRFDAYTAWVQKNKQPLILLDKQGVPQGILTCYDDARKLMFQHPGTDCHRLTPDDFAVCHSYRSDVEQSSRVIIIEHQDETPVAAYMGMIWEERLFDKNYRAPLKMKLGIRQP